MYEVLYDYKPQTKGDISLHQGDRIQRVNDVGCGWVIGHNVTTGETGHFPADYVQPMARWRQSLIFSSRKGRQGVVGESNSTKINPVVNKSISAKGFNIVVNYKSKTTIPPTAEHKDDKSVISENVEAAVLSKHNSEDLKKRKGKLLRTSRRQNRCLKSVLGVFVGLLLGLVVFLALFYSFHYSLLVASVISATSTLLLCIGLAVSSRCRCVALLVFPSLATGRGRAAFLSIITGFLLMGPVTNITYNANEVAISMACITELAYNQSQALQNKLDEPFQKISDQVKKGVEEVKQYGEKIDKAFGSLRSAVNSAEDFINNAVNDATRFKDRCTASVNSGFNDCQSSLKKLRDDCIKRLDPISSGVPNQVGTAVNGFVRNIRNIFRKKRRRRRRYICNDSNCRTFQRSKRGVFGKLCDVFNIGNTVCSGFKTLGVCNIVTLPGNAITGVFSVFRKTVDAYANLFEVDLKNSGSIGSNANSSQSAAQIINNIKSDLQEKINTATFYITILNRIISVSILLLILNAFIYERRYRSKFSFDNFYITAYFKDMDQKRKLEGQKSILPLKKKERKIYTDSRSLKMSVAEKSKCKIGLALVLLHAVICIMLIFFDFLLHFILYLLNKHGDVRFIFTGESSLNIEITGNGLIAKLFRVLISGISVSQVYNSTIDIDGCLPNPREPDNFQIYVLAILYVFALFLVVMQGYGQRLLHFIAAFFYPEREHQRVSYLYRRILVKRKHFIQVAKQLIMSNATHLDNKEMPSGNCVTRYLEKLPFCRRILQKNAHTCTNCEDTVEDIVLCSNTQCTAKYCEECFVEFDKSCPLCAVVGDDDVNTVFSMKL